MKQGMKFRLFFTVILLITAISGAFPQDIPDRPVPPRLVNDFAGILDRGDVQNLEQKLVAFNDSTSTQIVVVIIPDLKGYDPGDYAQRLGEKWGVGQKNTNNGVVILVKPKTPDSNGKAFIATGYGLEGVIPDLLGGEIVDNEMIPSFRNNDYYGGIDKATNTIMALARGEYTASEYGQKRNRKQDKFPGIGFIIIIIVLVMIFSGGRGRGRGRKITTGGLPLWMLMSMMGSGSRHSGGGWGGSGGFGGGGGGGFGGFGGGSFGGGGAGGSW